MFVQGKTFSLVCSLSPKLALLLVFKRKTLIYQFCRGFGCQQQQRRDSEV